MAGVLALCLLGSAGALPLAQNEKPQSAPAPPLAAEVSGQAPAGSGDTAEKSEGEPRPAPEVDAVNVVGANQKTQVAVDRKSYDLTDNPFHATGTVADVLRGLSSVEVSAQGAVSIRGDANVVVMIDGQPVATAVGMSGGAALQQLPAAQFARVEVITNPSAAFSSEGTGGVINLVRVKPKAAQRSLAVRGSTGTNGNFSLGLDGTLAADQMMLSIGSSVRSTTTNDQETIRRTYLTGAGSTASSESDMRGSEDRRPWNVRANGSYDLSRRVRLSSSGGIFSDENLLNRRGTFTEWITTPSSNDQFFLFEDSRSELNGHFLSAGLTQKEVFGAGVIDVRLNYTAFENQTERTDLRRPTVSPLSETRLESASTIDHRLVGFKSNFRTTFPSGEKLEAGYEANLTSQTRKYGTVLSDASSGPPVSNFSVFEYEQRLQAAFATHQFKFLDTEFLLGARVEALQTRLPGTGTEATDVRVFPSLHLSRWVGDNWELRGSYAVKIRRPSPESLDPTRRYFDLTSAQEGNPDLDPETTDSYELGVEYTKESRSFSAYLYLKLTRDLLTATRMPIGNNVTLQTQINAGRYEDGGLEFSYSDKISSTLSVNSSGTLAWARYGSTPAYPSGAEGIRANMKITLDWSPNDRSLAQVSFYAATAQKTFQGEESGYAVLNLGYRYKVTKRLTTVMTIADLLGSSARSSFQSAGFRETDSSKYSAPTFSIGLVLTFGGQAAGRNEAFDYGSKN